MFQLKDVKVDPILNIKALHFEQRRITSIIGKSGSGKSTLLKLLNHLISYDNGIIQYNGQDISTMDPIQLRREVVMLSQTPSIYDGTVKDNLLIGLKFSEKDTDSIHDQQLHDLLEKFDLHKKLDENADDLSGGEKQRLAFARIILMDPPVYLLDEPTSALDDETADEVMERFFQFIKSNQKTVIMVTHSLKVAEKFSDKIVDITNINDKEMSVTHG
ncbi:ABC transporter ATP-binding protein [Chengkuizengella axinellae]|uniref:ABC transporter ATP-binding protein n=1 Tax=Chengkuizengella axinellae TaxID=3064388 RepID=A0ABT9J180_9BACL|nr:ABC transporter ATP-binding protein [Chengkuizengella sp. 2205SS18-9]MDP5275362.1 ABC transporter ATP-binding protein [Chengkuizengella sp. 2205SS18-9]